jgi:hypothetical protein
MKKTAATIVLLCLIWIGYTAWPLYDLFVLVRAVEERDINTVVRYVYFDSVRKSLAGQVVAAYVRRTGTQLSPLAQGMAASAFGVADPIVNRLITPEALSELLNAGWPVAIDPVVPQGTVGITRNTIGTIWQVYRNSEYGLGRFEVSAPPILPPQRRIVLTFHLLGAGGWSPSTCHRTSKTCWPTG